MSSWIVRPRVRRRQMWIISGIIAAICVVVAFIVSSMAGRVGSVSERARRLAQLGRSAEAERLYWQALQSKEVDVETFVGFIDNRAMLKEIDLPEPLRDRRFGVPPPVSDVQIRRWLLARNESDPATALVRFWYEEQLTEEKADDSAVIALADRKPPVRWANHLLARAAASNGDFKMAARRFEIEGLSFPAEASDDLRRAIRIWMKLEAWDELRKRGSDPRFHEAMSSSVRREIAEHDKDWGRVLLWLWPGSFDGVRPWPIFLAIVAGSLWFAIGTKMGRIGDRARGRIPLYVAAFILGVISVYPTLVLITIEESIFGLKQLGEPIPDAIYFIFGVGLREELCKLLLFLPLVPILRKRNSPVEAITCAALVGLGFAAEENVGYFHSMDPSAALGRFLTANFLHMALTAMVGVSVYESNRYRSGAPEHFANVFPIAVLLHGAYDFLLASPQMGELSFLAMAIFIILSQRFLRQMLQFCSSTQQESVLHLFVISLTVLSGISYIYATTMAGPFIALQFVGAGLLGVAILIYMFVRELDQSSGTW